MIIGPTGAGKSSMLMALLGEMVGLQDLSKGAGPTFILALLTIGTGLVVQFAERGRRLLRHTRIICPQ